MPLLAAAIVALTAISTFGDIWVLEKPLDQRTIPFLNTRTPEGAVISASTPCVMSDTHLYTDSDRSLQLGSFPCLMPEPSDVPVSSPMPEPSSCAVADVIIVTGNSPDQEAREKVQSFLQLLGRADGEDGSVRAGVVSYGSSLWPPLYGIPFPAGVMPYAQPSVEKSLIEKPLSFLTGSVEPLFSGDVGEEGTCVSCGLYLARMEMERHTTKEREGAMRVVILLSEDEGSSTWDGTYDRQKAEEQTRSEIRTLQHSPYEFYTMGDVTFDELLQRICPGSNEPDSVPSDSPTPYLVH